MAMSSSDLNALRAEIADLKDNVIPKINSKTSPAEYKAAFDKMEGLISRLGPEFQESNGRDLKGALPHFGINTKPKKYKKSADELFMAAHKMIEFIDTSVGPYISGIETADRKKKEEQNRLDLEAKQKAEREALAKLERDKQQEIKNKQQEDIASGNTPEIKGEVNLDTNPNQQNLAGLGDLFGAVNESLRPVGEALEQQGNRYFGADFQSPMSFLGEESTEAIKGLATQAIKDINPELSEDIKNELSRSQGLGQIIDKGALDILSSLEGGDQVINQLKGAIPKLQSLGSQAQGNINRFSTTLGGLRGQSEDDLKNFSRESSDVTRRENSFLQNLINQSGMDAARNQKTVSDIASDRLSDISNLENLSQSDKFSLSKMAEDSSNLRREMTEGDRFGVKPLERNLGMLDQAGDLNKQFLGLADRGNQISGEANQDLSGLSDYLGQNIDVQGFRDLASRAEARPEDLAAIRQAGQTAAGQIQDQYNRLGQAEQERQGLIQGADQFATDILAAQQPFIGSALSAQEYTQGLRDQTAGQFGGFLSDAQKNEARILGQLGDVRSQFQGISQAEDPRFSAFKSAQQEELDFQKDAQIRQIQEDFARRGLSGSSAELNAIQNINNQFGRQGRALSSELGLQQLGRQDDALRTLSQLTGQEAAFLNQSLGQRAGLQTQATGLQSQLTGQGLGFADQARAAQMAGLGAGFDARTQVGFNALNQLGNQIGLGADLSVMGQNALTSGLTTAEDLRQAGMNARGGFMREGNIAASDLASRQSDLTQMQLDNSYRGLDTETGIMRDAFGNQLDLFRDRQGAQYDINNFYRDLIDQDIRRRSDLGAMEIDRGFRFSDSRDLANVNQYNRSRDIQRDRLGALDDYGTRQFGVTRSDIDYRKGLGEQFYDRSLSLGQQQFDLGQLGVDQGRQQIIDEGNLYKDIYGTSVNQAGDKLGVLRDLSDLVTGNIGTNVDLRTSLSGLPAGQIQQLGQALSTFLAPSNEQKSLELESLTAGIQNLLALPQFKTGFNAIG